MEKAITILIDYNTNSLFFTFFAYKNNNARLVASLKIFIL